MENDIMNKKRRAFVLALTVVAALILAAAAVGVIYLLKIAAGN